VSVIYLLPSYNKHGKFDKMPPKVVISSSVATTSGQGDTSIADSLDINSQLITRGQLQLVINQLQGNNAV